MKRWPLYLILGAFALWYLAPLYVMVITSLKSVQEIRGASLLALPQSFNTDAWAKAWSSACSGVRCEGLAPFFKNSLMMCIPAVIISTAIGAINGYVFSFWKFKGANILFTGLLLGCFIPFQIIILPMARLLGFFGLANTLTGLIFVHVVYGLAFTTLFFRNFFISIPDDLIKAARIDGAGFFTIFYRVLMPLALPIFVVSMIWQFTQIWNDFLFGVVFGGTDTMPITVALNNQVNTTTGVKEYNVDMAAAIIAGLPTLFVYIVAGRYFVRGLTAGAVKG